MKAYSNDLRRKVVSAYERAPVSQREIADVFRVSPATVRNFVRRQRERVRLTNCRARQLRQLIASAPDATLAEACDHLARVAGVRGGLSAVCRTLSKPGLARNKSRSTPASATRPAS